MPQPVVSSRYLFLCSPPKIVLAFKPDSRATFRKLTPRSGGGSGVPSFCPAFWRDAAEARSQGGRAISQMFSRDSTSADRLRDFKNKRREGNKRSLPGGLARLEFAPTSYMQRTFTLQAPGGIAPRTSRGRLPHSSAVAWHSLENVAGAVQSGAPPAANP